MGFHSLEHRILKKIKDSGLVGSKILIAYSGGRDSQALLHILHKIKKAAQLDLIIAYIHHGNSHNKSYRDNAWLVAKQTAQKLNLDFCSNSDELPCNGGVQKNSEEALREFRHQVLFELFEKKSCNFIGFAHHLEDLLETRLIRLIRGTGPEGIQAMKFIDGVKLRPFLDVSRCELESYLKFYQIEWLDDPTNLDDEVLRNWLRNNFLNNLETLRHGSILALARSLENLATDLSHRSFENFSEGISRSGLLSLNLPEQRQLLASYLHYLGAKKYSKNHIDEILKQLDRSSSNFQFSVAGFIWQVEAQQVIAHAKK